MMLATDAKIILARLKIQASLDHLKIRTLNWAALVYCAWIILSIASFIIDYGQLNFHAIILCALTSLPLFLLIPSAARSFIKTLRPFDIQTTVESYISGKNNRITKLQEKQTEEALRIISMKKFVKTRLSATWKISVAGSTILFIVFQAISLNSGQGFFISYVEKDQKPFSENLESENGINEYDYLTSDNSFMDRENAKTAGSASEARELRKEKSVPEDESFPSLVLGDKEKPENFKGAKESVDPGETLSTPEAEAGKGDNSNKNPASKEKVPEKIKSDSNSQNPGYQGSGTALQNNPLVDYTAYFERQFLAHSGKKTALSQIQTEAEFVDIIAAYYSSFTTIIDIKLQKDPAISAARQLWLEAFTAEAGK